MSKLCTGLETIEKRRGLGWKFFPRSVFALTSLKIQKEDLEDSLCIQSREKREQSEDTNKEDRRFFRTEDSRSRGVMLGRLGEPFLCQFFADLTIFNQGKFSNYFAGHQSIN